MSGLKRIFILACIIGATMTWAKPQSTNMNIYLVIGQSNMAGRADIPSGLSKPLDGVFLFTGDMSDLWVQAENPMNIFSSIRKEAAMQKLGPAYSFARKMKEKRPAELLGLVVNARGGSSIDEWLPGTHYFGEVVERASQARLFGNIAGVIWHQGESDVNMPYEYMGKLKQLIEGLRRELDLPQLPFVAGQLSEDTEERRTFNIMLTKLTDKVPYTQVVLSHGTTTFDGTHFDTPSQVLMGERYAEKMMVLASHEKPFFSFGLISDVQYADAEPLGKRDYRGSLLKLDRTIEILNAYELAFTVSLGDLIDQEFKSFEQPLKILENSKAGIHHVWGNHDFSVSDEEKKWVGNRLGNEKGYYSFEENGFVFIILNGMDISMEGHPEGTEKYNKAVNLMKELEASGANNAKPYNGGIGDEQLQWFLSRSREAADSGKKVVVFSHYPLLPENGLQLLNNRQLLDALDEIPTLVAWFSGHHHGGNYIKDERGIHHITFQGMVEAETEALGAVITVYPDKMIIHGIGHEHDRGLEIR